MARVVTVDEPLRAAVRHAIDGLGLGVTSPELGVSRETVRNLLNGSQDRFNIGAVAKLCIALEMTPEDVTDLGYPQLAREMGRRAPDPMTQAIRRTFQRG